jgi:Tol biopolymer transport system component
MDGPSVGSHPNRRSAQPFPDSQYACARSKVGSGYLLFLSSRGGGDGLWKLENGAARELWKGNEGGLVAPPAISSDGSQICFSYRKQGRAGLYIMDASGASIRELAPNLDVRGAASWSPDGKWVAVAANTEEGSRVYKIPVDGGHPVRLLDTTSYHPLWSPNGAFILYAEPLQGGTLSVKAISPDKAAIQLPGIEVLYTTSIPYRFAPNQKALIALQGGGSAGQNFNWLDLETGEQRRLTDFKTRMVIESFDVTPDGKQIVFDRVRQNSDIVMMDLAR